MRGVSAFIVEDWIQASYRRRHFRCRVGVVLVKREGPERCRTTLNHRRYLIGEKRRKKLKPMRDVVGLVKTKAKFVALVEGSPPFW